MTFVEGVGREKRGTSSRGRHKEAEGREQTKDARSPSNHWIFLENTRGTEQRSKAWKRSNRFHALSGELRSAASASTRLLRFLCIVLKHVFQNNTWSAAAESR